MVMGKVNAYGRVSSQRQADQGALERQERQLLEGVTADEILMDVGSGKTTARPAYKRLLELIGNGQVSRVLIKEQDRLNRNLKADLELWDLCQANGTKITDLHGREIEFRTPDGELLSTMVSAMNQHRSKAYGLKIRNGLQQQQGQHPTGQQGGSPGTEASQSSTHSSLARHLSGISACHLAQRNSQLTDPNCSLWLSQVS